jgi:hypothetical protein
MWYKSSAAFLFSSLPLAQFLVFQKKIIGDAETHLGSKIWVMPEQIWDVNVFWASPINKELG